MRAGPRLFGRRRSAVVVDFLDQEVIGDLAPPGKQGVKDPDLAGVFLAISPRFAAEAHRQSLAVSESAHADEDQAFVEAVSEPVGE